MKHTRARHARLPVLALDVVCLRSQYTIEDLYQRVSTMLHRHGSDEWVK